MILAGDIGGTKVHLAIFEAREKAFRAGPEATFRSSEHPSLQAVIHEFATVHPLEIDCACFGVAGPIRDGRVQPTNLSWIIDREELRSALGIEPVFLLNDLQANAYGIAGLAPSDFVELNRGTAVERGSMAVISAGTGLGQAAMFWNGTRYIAAASEGGHSDFAPRNELGLELLSYLRKRLGQVSWEHVLSGPGFYRIYQFLRDTGRGKEPGWLAEEFQKEDPAVAITRAGLEGKCRLCVETLNMFAGFYGAEASNLALKMLATGGVYVGGGIAPKIISKLEDSLFMKQFVGEGQMKNLLASIPVRVIMNSKAALIGAARYAAIQTGKMD